MHISMILVELFSHRESSDLQSLIMLCKDQTPSSSYNAVQAQNLLR